ncbi:MAG: SxtJ family membrane protein, partial [Planctomyces sp.]
MAQAIQWHPPARTLRQFGWLCAIVFGGWGVKLVVTAEVSFAGWGLVAVGLTAGLLGTLYPEILRPVFVGWMILVFPIGWAVSHLLLGLLFFGVFTPVGLLLRTFGKDSLRLQRGAASSLWQDRAQESDLRRYLR